MVDILTEEQTNEFKEIYDRFVNDENTIDTKDLGKVLVALGKSPNEAEIQDMIFEVDTDGNGTIGFFEFCALMIRMMKESDIEDELLEIFKVFDRDGNGSISYAELRYTMTHNLAEKIKDPKIREIFKKTDVEDLISKADRDQDGQIDYEEFVRMIMMETRQK